MSEKIFCKIYRSERQAGAYLYTTFDQGLEPVPPMLLGKLGELVEAMSITLESNRKLANADVKTVMSHLTDNGFYLQMPPGKIAAEETALAKLAASTIDVLGKE